MGQSRVQRVTLTIASGQTTSNSILSWQTYGSASGIMIHSPATLPETITLQVSPDNGTTWNDLQLGVPLANVLVPGPAKATYYNGIVLGTAIRLVAGAAVGGNRVFTITYQEIYN